MSILITADRLRRERGAHRILAVHWEDDPADDRPAFERERIPGAILVSGMAALRREPVDGEGRHPLPAPETFHAAVRSWGVQEGDSVVIYDDHQSIHASRLWWLLQLAGFGSARILDGGIGFWKTLGYPLESGPAAAVEPSGIALRWDGAPVVDGGDVLAGLGGERILVDARTRPRHEGHRDPELDPRGGRIPGAVSAFWGDSIGPDGRFEDAVALRARFEALGVREGAEVVSYCGSGVSASINLVALAIAGFGVTGLYPGSWSEWAADPERPVHDAGAEATDVHPAERSRASNAAPESGTP